MTAKHGLEHLEADLRALEASGLLRRRAVDGSDAKSDAKMVSFASNDYLGLADLPAVSAARGASGSRLISGDREEHRALERALAAWLDREDALVFTSGYAANVGLIGALVSRGDLAISDALNHASIIDGLRLARAEVEVVPHADVGAVRDALARHRRGQERRRAWVFVESYYSMDADGHDPSGLIAVCKEADATLVVDEAHALGILGEGGRGLYAARDVRPAVVVGTLSKALGCQGGFIAGPRVLRDWLWNRARSLVFSTGLAPVSAASARDSLERIVADPSLGQRVLERATQLRERLRAIAGDAVLGSGHIVPVLIGRPETAVRIAEAMRRDGIDVVAIRPPTVPAGSARLRLTVNARHSQADLDRAVAAFERAWAGR